MAAAWMLASAEIPHPRPDFERKAWQPLNGIWEFQFDPDDKGLTERWQTREQPFETTIRVPFGWESKLSGIQRTDYKGVAWYRREFSLPSNWQGKRIWLCFGAVDWKTQVWVNEHSVGEHEGGYSEFRLDITPQVRFDRPNRLVVRVEDRTDPETPLGKQIPVWYTSTSGIWQTVWLEATGEACIKKWRILPEGDAQGVPTGVVRIEIEIDRGRVDSPLIVSVSSPNRRFPTAQAVLLPDETQTEITLRVPNPRFWTPETPTLYPFVVRLLPERRGRNALPPLDTVRGYFGIRTVRWGRYGNSEHSFVLLNGNPIYLRGVLDQSFNPDGIYTAPNDEFLKRDIELAKRAGFNMLRIHIKADEPRKLYWADRLGMLIQADIPCAYLLTARARQLFERTMRDQIERDFNHPSLIIWTLFNEEWGIGTLANAERSHRVDWVLQMVRLARQLDPTRLIHDNSGWSHLETDLNSFHWYGRDVDGFRALSQQVNAREIGAGKGWNYIDGRASRGEPFINNEFSYHAAGDGDGDWSWGNLAVVNTLRSLDKLVGYTYTELTDIEWEHNGVYNYDRSPKEFGFDFWAEGMGVADLFAEDFLVIDVPAIKRAKRGEQVQVPLLFSHFSGRWVDKPLYLSYRLDWIDALGNRHRGKVVGQRITGAPPYRLTPLATLELTLPDQPALATLVAWLEDERGKRVHVNYTQWAVALEEIPPAEWLDSRRLAVRFRPNDYVQSQFSEQNAPATPIAGKHYGRGHGFVEYAIRLPDNAPIERLERLTLMMEVSAKAGREKVDWAQRIHPADYPQTDGKKFPSRVQVEINGQRVATWELPDDPADARGVLSHWAGVERGSYGYRREATLALTPSLRAQLQRDHTVHLRLIVPPELPGGIAIYGAQMGCYPLEPTLILRFK
ncbi:MAG: sugar-binding domain-containing protein [Armatimonadota bacterium]